MKVGGCRQWLEGRTFNGGCDTKHGDACRHDGAFVCHQASLVRHVFRKACRGDDGKPLENISRRSPETSASSSKKKPCRARSA